MITLHITTTAAAAAATCCIYITPFTAFRAGDAARCGTVAEAYVSLGALVVGSLIDGRSVRWVVGAGNESANDQGRGTSEASGALAPEAVWKCRTAGSGAPRKGDYRLPGAAEETDDVCGQTASGAWAGTAHPVSAAPALMREMTVIANWQCPSN